MLFLPLFLALATLTSLVCGSMDILAVTWNVDGDHSIKKDVNEKKSEYLGRKTQALLQHSLLDPPHLIFVGLQEMKKKTVFGGTKTDEAWIWNLATDRTKYIFMKKIESGTHAVNRRLVSYLYRRNDIENVKISDVSTLVHKRKLGVATKATISFVVEFGSHVAILSNTHMDAYNGESVLESINEVTAAVEAKIKATQTESPTRFTHILEGDYNSRLVCKFVEPKLKRSNALRKRKPTKERRNAIWPAKPDADEIAKEIAKEIAEEIADKLVGVVVQHAMAVVVPEQAIAREVSEQVDVGDLITSEDTSGMDSLPHGKEQKNCPWTIDMCEELRVPSEENLELWNKYGYMEAAKSGAGKYICVDWFSSQLSSKREPLPMPTFTNYKEGKSLAPFAPTYPAYKKQHRCPGHADRIFAATWEKTESNVIKEVKNAFTFDQYGSFPYIGGTTPREEQSDHIPVYGWILVADPGSVLV